LLFHDSASFVQAIAIWLTLTMRSYPMVKVGAKFVGPYFLAFWTESVKAERRGPHEPTAATKVQNQILGSLPCS
jgi:hypothetical protein